MRISPSVTEPEGSSATISTTRARGEAFASLLEAGALVEAWRIGYNTVRPHNARGQLTPTDHAKAWATSHPELS